MAAILIFCIQYRQAFVTQLFSSRTTTASWTSDDFYLKRGKMTRITKLLLMAAILIAAAFAASSSASAQQGYGQGYGPPPKITCSSNNGKRNYCDIGGSRDARLVRQISGSPCIQGNTWGVDRGGLWVDRGCRAEFIIGRGGPPPSQQSRIVTCSSNDGKRNWCDIGSSRDVRLARQISGSACIQGSTWGLDRRGLWVDRGCRADFKVRY
jgi:hypothetical protein